MINEKISGTIIKYIVDKDYDDDKLIKVLDRKLKSGEIINIINHDADVYTKEGKLLLHLLTFQRRIKKRFPHFYLKFIN